MQPGILNSTLFFNTISRYPRENLLVEVDTSLTINFIENKHFCGNEFHSFGEISENHENLAPQLHELIDIVIAGHHICQVSDLLGPS